MIYIGLKIGTKLKLIHADTTFIKEIIWNLSLILNQNFKTITVTLVKKSFIYLLIFQALTSFLSK